MSPVKFINPEGMIVNVPAEEAEQFDAMGWERAEDAAPKKDKTKKPA